MKRVQTIEQTGKLWKLCDALGALGMIGGLVAYFQVGPDPALQRAAGIIAGLSVLLWLFGRAGAWLFHA